jgi:hypothetical protein
MQQTASENWKSRTREASFRREPVSQSDAGSCRHLSRIGPRARLQLGKCGRFCYLAIREGARVRNRIEGFGLPRTKRATRFATENNLDPLVQLHDRGNRKTSACRAPRPYAFHWPSRRLVLDTRSPRQKRLATHASRNSAPLPAHQFRLPASQLCKWVCVVSNSQREQNSGSPSEVNK